MPDLSLPDSPLEQKLDIYEALLKKWQRSINLVSNSTINDARLRHINDSLQMADLVSQGVRTLFDFGSGAGFPAMVIAMARQEINVTLVESDQRKCTFLSTVSRETSTAVTIANERIESLAIDSIPDIITARALAPLDKLCGFALPYAQKNPDVVMLFMKGERADEEIAEAQALYRFTVEKITSKTDERACILRISNLDILDIPDIV